MEELAALGPWPWARALKLFGLSWLAVGLVVAVVAPSRRARLLATYAYAVPGFVVAYAGGWLLMKWSGRALTTPWVLVGAAAGLAALHSAFLVSHRARPRALTARLTWGCASAALATMALRTEDTLSVATIAIGGLVVGALAASPWASAEPSTATTDLALASRGLRWIAWVEGGSLLLMVGVAMPLRRAFGIQLDGGTGLLGWCHGVLVIVFVQALASTVRLHGWPRKEVALGVLSALLPGGSFWFERRVHRRVRAP